MAIRYLQNFFEHKKFISYVTIDQDCLVGALSAHEKIRWNNDEVFIEEIFVIPNRQSQGIGTKLFGEVQKYVQHKRLAGITLATYKYAPVQRFYEKNGFIIYKHVQFMGKEI